MLRAAIADHPGFRIEDVELRKDGTSYTVDTVAELQSLHPGADFYWIVGSDMVLDLPNWRRIEELAERVVFIGLERPDRPSDDGSLPGFIRDRLIRAEMPAMGLSSTDIRNRIKLGLSVKYRLPDAVIDYLQRNGLYES